MYVKGIYMAISTHTVYITNTSVITFHIVKAYKSTTVQLIDMA